jgi:hypothetical protein
MTAQIISALTVAVLTGASAVVIFFFMLLAMNGFSESDATWGLVAYIALSLAMALLVAGAAIVIVHFLLKKQFSSAVAALISIAICTCMGVIAEIISSVVGILIADFVRVNY